jgi:MFS family permease
MAASKLSLWQVIRRLAAIKPYRRMVLASAGPNVTVYVLLSWAPAFAMRTFHVSAGRIGPLIGLGFSVLGAAAIIGGGVITDRLNRKSQRTAVRLTGVIQLLVVPLLVLALFAGSFWTFIVAASLAYGSASFFASPNWALTQNAAPPQMRASAAALMLLVFNAFGLGVGPPLVGAVSDLLVGHFGTESLKYALLIPAAFSAVAGLMFFWVAACLPGVPEAKPARP